MINAHKRTRARIYIYIYIYIYIWYFMPNIELFAIWHRRQLFARRTNEVTSDGIAWKLRPSSYYIYIYIFVCVYVFTGSMNWLSFVLVWVTNFSLGDIYPDPYRKQRILIFGREFSNPLGISFLQCFRHQRLAKTNRNGSVRAECDPVSSSYNLLNLSCVIYI